MSTRKLLPGLLLLVVVLAACSFTTNNDNTDEAVVATAVEAQLQTQAAAEQEDQDDDQDPEQDQEDIPDQPVLYPGAGACREMVGWMDEYFGVQPEITSVNFGEAESGVAGEGCQVLFSATGEEMTDWGSRTSDLVNSIFAGGWMEDLNFSAGLSQYLL